MKGRREKAGRWRVRVVAMFSDERALVNGGCEEDEEAVVSGSSSLGSMM